MIANNSPTQFELALLAAIVARGTSKPPLEVAAYAWQLWCDSGEVLRFDGEIVGLQLLRFAESPEASKSWRESGWCPSKFPATLDDFLRLIVRAKTPADSMKRLRDFFRCRHAEHPNRYRDAADTIAEIKAHDCEGGYFADFQMWRSKANAYGVWWMNQKSLKASQSAQKRKPRT